MTPSTEDRLKALEDQQKELVRTVRDARVGLKVLGVLGAAALAVAGLAVAIWNSTGGGIKGG